VRWDCKQASESVEKNNGGCLKGVSRTEAFIFRGRRHYKERISFMNLHYL
jgi:hypothetical protein